MSRKITNLSSQDERSGLVRGYRITSISLESSGSDCDDRKSSTSFKWSSRGLAGLETSVHESWMKWAGPGGSDEQILDKSASSSRKSANEISLLQIISSSTFSVSLIGTSVSWGDEKLQKIQMLIGTRYWEHPTEFGFFKTDSSILEASTVFKFWLNF